MLHFVAWLVLIVVVSGVACWVSTWPVGRK